ncbi:MAG: ImpA domain-containing protein [Acidobacteria bacterium OLB17]|nr:MAG: ImpA domain-containing protein [Acidobacteria bacterium OLB17]MCZ2391019.1 type VI secretion system protein TssA [Acidobacteriota bacterium]
MSDVTSIPQVIDIEALLAPISEENPGGDSLRYSGIYDEIAEARRADADLAQGEWQTELKTADHRKVVEVAVNALTTLSKDLQIAAWLGEALIKLHGFAGLRDGLKLMAGLHANFWDGAFPVVEDGDQEGRANAVSWLESNAALAIRDVPITAGAGLSFNDWQDAKRFDIPANLASLDAEAQERWNDLRAQAERENRTTADKWKAAVGATRRAFCEQTQFTFDECREAVEELNSTVEAVYERNQMPGLSTLKKALDEVGMQTKKLLERKRIEEPDPADQAEENGSWSDEEGGSTGSSGIGSGPINGRPEALRRLEEVAAFFQKTEPHSPVSYLVQRAVKWGNMPLESWLEEVIKDENVLGQLRDTLGIGHGGASGGGGGWDTGYEEPAETSEPAASEEW